MNSHRILPTAAALAGVLALAALPSSAGAVPTSTEAVSANWAGYAAGSGSAPFSRVSGSWVEPTDDCTAGAGDAAFWVGLGGANGQSGSLEQIGTEANCTGPGSGDYYAWYELVPAAPVRLGMAIQPGDTVSASVAVSGTNVTVSLSDQTSGGSTSKTLQMSDPDTSSAEWIAEAPSTCSEGTSGCQPLPLADFGTVTFSGASATAGGHTGTISDSSWSASAVDLVSSGAGGDLGGAGFAAQQSSAGASPTVLSSSGSSFSVAWSPSSAPSSTSAGAGSDGAAGGGGYGYDGSGGYGYGYDGSGGYGYGGGYGDGFGSDGYGAGSGWYGGYGYGY